MGKANRTDLGCVGSHRIMRASQHQVSLKKRNFLRRGGFGLMDFRGAEVGEEGGQDADGGKIGADMVDEINVGEIGELA